MAKDGGWFKTRLGEGVAIVLSILLAFAIDASWDAAQEREEESRILQALRVEYAANLDGIDQTLQRHTGARDLVFWVLEADDAEVEDLSSERIADVLYGLALPFTFDPNLGTTATLRSGGRLSVLRDEELQRLLMEFTTMNEDMGEDREYVAHFAKEIWREEVRLGGPWVGEGAVGALMPAVRHLVPPEPPTVADLRRVREDPEMPGLLRRYHQLVSVYLSELGLQRETLLEILERLPE